MSSRDKKLKDKQAKLIAKLAEVCEALNWLIVIPQEETTAGLIIGNKEYVTHAAKRVYGNEYEIINPKSSVPVQKEETDPEEDLLEAQVVELSEEEYEKFLETGELPESVNLPSNKPTLH